MGVQAKIDLFDLVEWVSEKYKIKGASVFMRFGDGTYNGSSVQHLHAQLIVGVCKSDITDSIKVKLGYKNG